MLVDDFVTGSMAAEIDEVTIAVMAVLITSLAGELLDGRIASKLSVVLIMDI